VVVSFLSGKTRHTFGTILELIYRSSCYITHAVDDPRQGGHPFMPEISPELILHAKPALTTWAVNQVTDLVRAESKVMAGPEAGLCMRARPTRTNAPSNRDPSVTWDAISNFSFHSLQRSVEENAPVMWHLISSYSNDSFKNGRVYAVRKYRPQNLGNTDNMMALTFIKTWRASFYPICRAVYLFATKSHRSLFRVDSRLGRSVSFNTVYASLKTMAEQRQRELQEATRLGSGRNFAVVGDNVQAFAKQRDHRIGRESRMIKGFAGAAVEMADFDPAAFDVDELVRRQQLQERRQLSVNGILEDVDFPHLDTVATFHFLRALIEFVPILSIYHDELSQQERTLQKNQITPTRRTNIIPLATNSADEIYVQGMREAVTDFLETQMNITEENLGKRVIIFSGDGKTFDQLLRLKKYLVMHDGDLESLRSLAPMLELWHTKWTELSRLIRTHWGKGYLGDASALGCLGESAECPTPSDLRKVDFHNGAHLVNLALDANLLNCWEYVTRRMQPCSVC
ncbi:hypothetical protein BV22DRAFT_1026962, partial [Leucogyrophana mollusca]